MKRIKYYLAVLVTGALMLSSCSESFFDVNTDPNNPAEATPALVLPSGISGAAYVMGGYYQSLGAFWSQHYAQSSAASQWSEWESYNLTEDNFNRQFTLLYSGSLYDFEYVRNKSKETENWKYYAIATLMQSYTFHVLADLYDKIPFTEALKGEKILQPKYDDGQLVYDSLLARIDEAISKDFNVSSAEDPGKSDLIFGGDMAKWKQFANTLKLKIYLRYVNVDATAYQSEIQALLTENNFLTTADAKFAAFKNELTGYNPFYNTFVDRLSGNVIANKTLMDYFNDNVDPRKEKVFKASETGSNYNSLATGAHQTATGTIKDYATPNIGPIDPVYFFTIEEVYFLIAEAEQRYGTPANATAAYNAGIEASLVANGLAADAKTYPYNGLKSIMEQKWVAAANKRGIESFFDFNRTGYPDFFSKSLTSVLNGTDRPKRLFFPDSERKSNSNTPAKVALNVKVWWGL